MNIDISNVAYCAATKEQSQGSGEYGNLHFPLFWTIQNANYSPEPRLCSFVAAQFETSLLQLQTSHTLSLRS